MLNYRWRERSTDSLIFMQGRSLPFDTGLPHWRAPAQDPKDYDLVLHTEASPEKWLQYDCLPNNTVGNSPVVNSRTLALLSTLCPEDFQAFPVVIKNENSKIPDFENHDYHLINITHRVRAVDSERTVFSTLSEELGGSPIGVRGDLYLHEKCLNDHHLVRDDILDFILVSPELVALFKKEKIKGVRFMKEEEYYH